ncbi:hypothetical protein HHI36_021683 [Cryptolaemus montrouzieri]|uniref:Uncharacterized protein n=1 Tax=Cryptolaemus montrouzieri TaxID=559131 RepID=A0ABD2MXX4_9CUCU
MDVSNIETTHTSDFIELDDKRIVNQFIDAREKIWDRNNFIESYEDRVGEQTNSCKFDLPKIETGVTKECFHVKSEDFSFNVERKISVQELSIKHEPSEEVKLTMMELEKLKLKQIHLKEIIQQWYMNLLMEITGMKSQLLKIPWKSRKLKKM